MESQNQNPNMVKEENVFDGEERSQSVESSENSEFNQSEDIKNGRKKRTSSSVGSSSGKRARKPKAEHACIYCRRSHMTCDNQRPCSRCIARNIGHMCHDVPTSGSRGGRTKHSDSSTPGENDSTPKVQPPNAQPLQNFSGPSTVQAPYDNGIPKVDISGDWNFLGQQSILSQTLKFNQNNPIFYSEHAGSEFSSLNDFLAMIDEPALLDDTFQNNTATENMATGNRLAVNPANQGSTSPRQVENTSGNNTDKEPGADSAKDKFFLTAADPSEDISPEERLKQVIHAKLEAGLLQPFNYVKGYQRLQKYMDNYMNQTSKQRILKPLSVFRPAFRAVAKSLKDVDLVLVEESFERMVLEYDRVFTSMAIPACLWRRTGEIFRGNKEFAGLVDVNVEDLRDGKLAIYELLSEESAVNYWEKYGGIAFDSGQKAVLTSCNLRTRDGRKRRQCCFSFTIRRDKYNIPSCIIGNFIPIHP